MKCICCLSNRIIPRPLGLDGYYGCLRCGLFFRARDKGADNRENLISHYQNVDPHEKVADLKQPFFNSALAYLSLQCNKKKKSILDVGCGYGYFLDLAARNGWHTSGVETMNDAAMMAEKRIGKRNIFHGTLKEAKYPDNSFDVITLWDVLFIAENPFEEPKECYRVLKEGGIIGIRLRNISFQKMAYRIYAILPEYPVLCTGMNGSLFRVLVLMPRPVGGVIHYSLKKINPQLSLKNPSVFHQYCFSSKSIYQLLLRVGFTNIKVTNSPLTEGDPYSYTYNKGLVKAAKGTINLFSRLGFWISGGRWVLDPSLLVWAEKPRSSLKINRLKPND